MASNFDTKLLNKKVNESKTIQSGVTERSSEVCRMVASLAERRMLACPAMEGERLMSPDG